VAALIRSRYPKMPWYQVDQRLTGTAIPEGTSVPSDGYGYGIMNPARAVNATAYPVAASAPDPAYAKFRAWLATPAGISFAQANGLGTGAAPSTGAVGAASSSPAVPGSGVSAVQVLEAIGGVIGIGVLAVFGQRARSGRRRAMVRAGMAYGRAARADRGSRQPRWDLPQQGYGGPPGTPSDPAPPGYPPVGYPPAGFPPAGYSPAGNSPGDYPPAGYTGGQPPPPEQPGGTGPAPQWWQQDEKPPGR
jgi:hypothetical protein